MQNELLEYETVESKQMPSSYNKRFLGQNNTSKDYE